MAIAVNTTTPTASFSPDAAIAAVIDRNAMAASLSAETAACKAHATSNTCNEEEFSATGLWPTDQP